CNTSTLKRLSTGKYSHWMPVFSLYNIALTISWRGTFDLNPLFVSGKLGTISNSIISLLSTWYTGLWFYVLQHKFLQPFSFSRNKVKITSSFASIIRFSNCSFYFWYCNQYLNSYFIVIWNVWYFYYCIYYFDYYRYY